MGDAGCPVAVFVEVTALPGKKDELLTAARRAFESVREEEGTEVYSVHTCEAEPDVIRFYEVYRDASARQAHSESEAVRKLVASLSGKVAGPPRIVVTTPILAKGHSADGGD